MNEELRSASEELETSREELQSINEELVTVNHELKSKVDELALSNSDLHNLINATAIATIFLDRDLRITRYTPSAVVLFHLIPADIGRPLEDIRRRIDYQELENDVRRVIEQLTPTEREVGDHGKWYLARIQPYRTLDDRIAGAVLTFVDVSDRKHAEEAIAADLADTALLGDLAARLVNDENSATFFEGILDAAITITSADAGTVQIFEPATEALELLVARGFDRTMIERFQHVSATSLTACGLALKRGERTFADYDDADTNEEAVLHVKAGLRSSQATPLVSRSGAALGMLNTHWHAPRRRLTERETRVLDLLARQAADLVERRQVSESLRSNERRLRAVVESLPGGAVCVVDRDLRYQLASGEAFEAAGFRPEDFLGRTVADAVGPELAEHHESNYRRALAGETFDITHRAHDREFQTRGVPLRDDTGAVTGVLAVSFDVTERRRIEDALAASRTWLEDRVRERTVEVQTLFQRLLSAQEDERKRIALDIHDQLGQQMTALRMNLEAWLIRTNDAPLLEQAERTQRLAEELDHSIDFLTSELRPPALDHFGLAAALRTLVTSWSERFGIAAEFDLSGHDRRLPPAVETNIYRLAQEALHNVVKHASATHVTVALTWSDEDVVLVIEDNGRGLERSPTSDRIGGGLGLTSMRERAGLAGGRLEIESEPGRGTTLFVRVPIRRETSNDE